MKNGRLWIIGGVALATLASIQVGVANAGPASCDNATTTPSRS